MQSMIAPKPWLLYAYPWQPFPRRLIIYLRERSIPASLVTIVPVSDVQNGDQAPPEFPARPAGSLPILMIPQGSDISPKSPVFVKQSIAIMEFIDELCLAGRYGFPKLPNPPTLRTNLSLNIPPGDEKVNAMLLRAKHNELLTLAAGLTDGWNPVRLFGSGAGTQRIPAAANETLQWVRRNLMNIENWMEENEYDPTDLRWDSGSKRPATIAEITLFQFFEFTRDCYGVDMTEFAGGQSKDVYGRDAKQESPNLKLFFKSFLSRPGSAREADKGEVPPEKLVKAMTDWSEGVF
ncbi:hypothetical protein N7468_009467 [Penicillium chermesinum]|uniref:GST N-terminal domain-containing protein n=1 Tax=Penicillium chermesinum TaxID=63820 RepID=A0A9W9TF13_9EURO|nr:uncharacterized protein N7468_009467 [Penicillium chermesinum]KAJ5220263.1 hypothetical protein N7468_009467 [Penicillium chermesinum]